MPGSQAFSPPPTPQRTRQCQLLSHSNTLSRMEPAVEARVSSNYSQEWIMIRLELTSCWGTPILQENICRLPQITDDGIGTGSSGHAWTICSISSSFPAMPMAPYVVTLLWHHVPPVPKVEDEMPFGHGPRQFPDAPKTWDLSKPDLANLLDLSKRLNLDGEITPVMAWGMILSHERFSELRLEDFQKLTQELGGKIRCYGYVIAYFSDAPY